MNKLLKWTVVPLASLIITACSDDPKAPTIGNYKAAIQKVLNTQNETCFIIINSGNVYFTQKYPFSYDTSTDNIKNNSVINRLNSWVERGILELKNSESNGNQSTFEYDYTEQAKKSYKIEGRTICVPSKKIVEEIIQASEPLVDSFSGETSVNAIATYKIIDLPDWATDDESFKALREGKYRLILMHDGWVESSQLK